MALDRIIERVGEVKVTAAAVVAAIRLSAKLDSTSAKGWEDGGGLAGGSADGGLGQGRKFVLSLEGLPRTDAVTGHEGRGEGSVETVDYAEGEGRVSQIQTRGSGEPECQGHRLKPVPPESGRPQAAPTKDNGGLEATGGPPSPRPLRTSGDPRVVLGEDGRVAGMSWPWRKGKTAFAQGRRWGVGGVRLSGRKPDPSPPFARGGRPGSG